MPHSDNPLVADGRTLEEELESLPDQVAAFLEVWRLKTLEREKTEALLYVQFKGEDKERSATEIRALINASEGRYRAVLDELKSEAQYQKVYERLMAKKLVARLRVAM